MKDKTGIAPTATVLNRRRVFAGAGTVGALAAAAAVLPVSRLAAPEAQATAKAPDPAGGYQATAHVLQYYQTARV